MKIICVEKEELSLQLRMAQCREADAQYEVEGYTDVWEALKSLAVSETDVAVIGVEMPDIGGIDLAILMKEKQPDLSVIFVAESEKQAFDSFAAHPDAYLLKPVDKSRLHEEIEYALLHKSGKPAEKAAHVEIRTFGNFDVYVDGQIISFGRSKAKELLAYLVDRNGGYVSRAEAFALLWEEGMYDRPMQKQLDVIIRSLRSTLNDYGIGDILEMHSGTLRIFPEKVSCDMYRFLAGDAKAVASYRGEYMSNYSWASLTEAYVTRSLI